MTFSLEIKTATQIEADALADALADARNVSLTRREFCLRLAQYGILPSVDAIEAAKGDWPASMSSFLEYLDDAQSADAQIEWAATGSIDRMHTFVLTMGSWLSLSDAQIDDLFGIDP